MRTDSVGGRRGSGNAGVLFLITGRKGADGTDIDVIAPRHATGAIGTAARRRNAVVIGIVLCRACRFRTGGPGIVLDLSWMLQALCTAAARGRHLGLALLLRYQVKLRLTEVVPRTILDHGITCLHSRAVLVVHYWMKAVLAHVSEQEISQIEGQSLEPRPLDIRKLLLVSCPGLRR